MHVYIFLLMFYKLGQGRKVKYYEVLISFFKVKLQTHSIQGHLPNLKLSLLSNKFSINLN